MTTAARSNTVSTYRLYIDGAWTDASGGATCRSSASASSSASRSIRVSTRCASASIAQIPVARSSAQRA